MKLLLESQHQQYIIRLYENDTCIQWQAFNPYGNPIGINNCQDMLSALHDAEHHLNTHIWLYGQAGESDALKQWRYGKYIITCRTSIKPKVIFQSITPSRGEYRVVGVDRICFHWTVHLGCSSVVEGFADTPERAVEGAVAFCRMVYSRDNQPHPALWRLPDGFGFDGTAQHTLDELLSIPLPGGVL